MAGPAAAARGGRADHDRRAYGERGGNPARQHSFIVTEELAPTISLEDYTAHWLEQPPSPRLKHALIAEVARMAGTMHRAGVNHRDFYICHFLLHTDAPVTANALRLSLIDLHRAQTRDAVPRRWRDKDLAGLYFSALGIGLTERDKLRFLRGYFRRPLRQVLREEAGLLDWLRRKAARLQLRYARKYAPGPAREPLATEPATAAAGLRGVRHAREGIRPGGRAHRPGSAVRGDPRHGRRRALLRQALPCRRQGAAADARKAAGQGRMAEPEVLPGARHSGGAGGRLGLERYVGLFGRGAMITLEVPNTLDLATMARNDDPRLADRAWVEGISRQVAQATRTLHAHRFAHNDLKWRNLLVNDRSELFLIDCPTGGFWWGPFLRRRIVKDLACLDKLAKQRLSRTQRLRFFLHYQGRDHLVPEDKPFIDRILRYFEGRE